MKITERQKAVKEFIKNWRGHGYEKGESQKFWIDLLTSVFGVSVSDIANFIFFEEQVKNKIQNKTITNFIDAYIPSTRVMIEQKSNHKNLREPIKQSDGSLLTPFQQAKKYVADLPLSQHPKWIVTCNFDEFLIYDMENPSGEPEQVFLKDLEKDFYRLQFLVDQKNENIRREEEISIQAGKLVGKLYDAISPEYKNPDENSFRSLNILCVRIVFCLYAEDAGLFETRTSFEDYIKGFNLPNLRAGIINLFKALDTKIEDRNKYDETLKSFPYVNGGLFRDEQIEIPNFTQNIVDVIINECAPFNWSEISPTIFGAVFESTLNPETRRKGGMHYTSIENIHKVIDPLFLNDLNAEFDDICSTKIAKQKTEKLHAFQQKLGSLKFLDPACGSGNFLTETYLSLRRLENKVISILNKGERSFGFDEFIKVHINQFYGIEINDFAVTVAKTALWIAESQMVAETEAILSQTIDFLPLTTNAFIIEGNALRMDWATLKDLTPAPLLAGEGELDLFSGFTTQVDGTVHEYDYIMGNPPFVGQAFRTKEQAAEMQAVFAPSTAGGKLDYVAGWYKKAADLIRGTDTECAFVSSNSICQGESVNLLWEDFLTNGIFINFAHATFKWTSESTDAAAVMCVVVGFSYKERKEKLLFASDQKKIVEHINGYLAAAPDVFIKNRSKSINAGTATVVQGSPPADDGKLLMTAAEREGFIKKYPELETVIKPFVGSKEFINDSSYSRYCFWFADAKPSDFQHIKELRERFEFVHDFRLKSPVDRIQKTADKPYLFTQNRQPKTDYLIIPRVSSSKRRYIPIGFLPPDVIASDAAVLVYDATLFEFGLISSNVHNSWM
ncbi:MAG: class I SAM-dependent DNA methyltransferase, partial [Bacteroidales bacterium]|nr:class I SAM-dependent DNA methyltransferase [Bacteroidales bacterium]